MMRPLIFDFPTPSPLGTLLREQMDAEEGKFINRSFPDGETYLRVESKVSGRPVIVNATLFHPNDWFLDLLFLSDALHAQGATRVILLAPYLAYMRQDKVFTPGEALTSSTFSRLISSSFDSMVTVDPHLHRYHSLSEIYSIPTTIVKAAPLISEWIQDHIKDPFIIGPDAESRQWVEEIAQGSPFIVLTKTRFEDGHVEITWPDMGAIHSKQIVLVDDIISSGVTIDQSLKHLNDLRASPPMCIAIHPIFAQGSYETLLRAGVKQIVTCNSIPHPSNGIDLTPLLVPALTQNLEGK